MAAPQQELLDTRGLNIHSAAAVKLVQASPLRLARAEAIERPILGNWNRLIEYLADAMSRERTEQFRVLFLDVKNRLIADEAQARGTVNHTPVYPREVVKRVLELHATALILVHKHASGDPTPSRADVEMMREVKGTAAVLQVVVLDHVIIGSGSWLSFRHEGCCSGPAGWRVRAPPRWREPDAWYPGADGPLRTGSRVLALRRLVHRGCSAKRTDKAAQGRAGTSIRQCLGPAISLLSVHRPIGGAAILPRPTSHPMAKTLAAASPEAGQATALGKLARRAPS
jgi:DNA repair protein RadC